MLMTVFNYSQKHSLEPVHCSAPTLSFLIFPSSLIITFGKSSSVCWLYPNPWGDYLLVIYTFFWILSSNAPIVVESLVEFRDAAFLSNYRRFWIRMRAHRAPKSDFGIGSTVRDGWPQFAWEFLRLVAVTNNCSDDGFQLLCFSRNVVERGGFLLQICMCPIAVLC